MTTKDLDATNEKFRGQFGSGKWSLCIGAGVSRGIVPTWQELTRRLVNETFGMSVSQDEFQKLVADTSWSLDSWIQACANHYLLSGRKLDDFYDLIERHMYSDMRLRAKSLGLENALVTVLDRPRNASREEVARICDFFEKEYADSTLIAIVKVLLSAVPVDRLPEAVVSFNADTLLHTLIELYQRHIHYCGPPPHSHPKYLFKTILRPLNSAKDLVPIYHCHGAIKPKSGSSLFVPRDSRDRLVFLESEYIRVATVSASWAETLFMFHAQTTRLLLVGFSMSDPNMRRWLALSNESALQDRAALSSGTAMTPRHIWLTRPPVTAELRILRNEALVHLGVRPGWVKDWNQTELAMRNLLAI